MNSLNPSYITLHQTGELEKRSYRLEKILFSCRLCPRECGINRLKGDRGFCRSGYLPAVQCYTTHFGEEPVISGRRGSGTVFFGNCNLRCVYCQNYEISQNLSESHLKEISIEECAAIFLELQNKGCHNINLVSPVHFVPQIVKSLYYAVQKGLHIPVVYNTNSYDSVETLKHLDGIIDIYIPDIKYGSDENALRYSNAPQYVEHSRRAIREMWRQVGNIKTDIEGIAESGTLIRHLILPGNIAGSYESLKFIAEYISPDANLSIMSQYYPTYKAGEYPGINRPVNKDEYEGVIEIIESLGMEKNTYIQKLNSHKYYQPQFNNKDMPFKV